MHKIFLPFAILSLLVACAADDDAVPTASVTETTTPVIIAPTETEKPEIFQDGLLLVHQGDQSSSARVSFGAKDLSSLTANIYEDVNEATLGIQLHSMTLQDNWAFLVMDTQDKVQLLNRYSFQYQRELSEGLDYPQHIALDGNLAYISNWGDPLDYTETLYDDFIAVMDVSRQRLLASIPMDLGPEKLCVYGDKLYVTHKGGWGANNQLSIIDLNTYQVLQQLTLGDLPDTMIVRGTELWVASQGAKPWHGIPLSAGSITVIDLLTDTIVRTLTLPNTDGLTHFCWDTTTEKFYYSSAQNVYALSPDALSLPTTALFTTTDEITDLLAHEGDLYVLTQGTEYLLKVYDLDTDTWFRQTSLASPKDQIYVNE